MKIMSNTVAARSVGAALMLLSKATSGSAAAAGSTAGRHNWARVFSSTGPLRVRGGASTTEEVGSGGSSSPPSLKDPFKHLPGIEVLYCLQVGL